MLAERETSSFNFCWKIFLADADFSRIFFLFSNELKKRMKRFFLSVVSKH